MDKRLLSACIALPLVSGCAQLAQFLSAAPPPLQRAPLQDADAILQTMKAPPKHSATAVARLDLHRRLPPLQLTALDGPPLPQPLPVKQARPVEADVMQTIEAWRTAWENGDAPNYLRFYEATFKGDARSRTEWEKQRAVRLANGRIKLAIYQLQVALAGEEADVRFVQAYTSGRHSDHGEKRMKLRRDAGAWKIVQESWSPR